jgi:membrane protein YqaA with SNARE-associated domain
MNRMITKRKAFKAVGALILILLFAAFLGSLLYHQEIKASLAQEIQAYGAIGCLLGGFVADSFGGPIGPEWPVIAGIMAGIKLPTALLMTSIGSVLATIVVYWVGYAFGDVGAREIFTVERFDRWQRIFLRNRRITMLLAALTPVPYVTCCVLAGIFKMRPWEYLVFTILPRVFRIVTAAYIALLLKGAF